MLGGGEGRAGGNTRSRKLPSHPSHWRTTKALSPSLALLPRGSNARANLRKPSGGTADLGSVRRPSRLISGAHATNVANRSPARDVALPLQVLEHVLKAFLLAFAVGAEAPESRVRELSQCGATVVSCRTRDGKVDLGALLAELFVREVRGVLVEGGGEVHGAFLDAGLVDRVAMFAAPLLIGGRRATPVIAGAGRELKSAVRLGAFAVTTLGDDLLIEADVVREPRGA